MERSSRSSDSLDALAARARAGETAAQSTLLSELRVRFLAVAKRRVRDDELEDVVQEALGIVHERHPHRGSPTGILPWSLMVLRNVIGNTYQARSRGARHEVYRENLHGAAAASASGALAPDPLARQEAEELRSRLLRAIDLLARERPRCGAIFRRVLESLECGGSPGEISRRARELAQAEDPGLSAGNFYVILHRCRARLREILRSIEEVDPRSAAEGVS